MSSNRRNRYDKFAGSANGFPLPPENIAENASDHPNIMRGLAWSWAVVIGLLAVTAILNASTLPW